MVPSTYSASNSKIEPLSMINQAQGLAIDVKNLCKKFGNKVAVDNVSIAQPAGSVWGFLGPNGSGKTTTIRMLCGLLEPTSGEGSCLGFDVVKQSREIKNLTGYMTQKFSFWEDLTIKENLDFVARLYEMPNRRKIVEKTLIDLGLEKRQHQLAGSLSGGWKQRLALAAVTMHEPKLLLLDEPTAGVDPQARRDFWQQIHRLSEQGLTVLVSTHYMDEAERCDHIVYLAYGKLITQGTVNEIIQQSGLIAFETRVTLLSKYSKLSLKVRQKILFEVCYQTFTHCLVSKKLVSMPIKSKSVGMIGKPWNKTLSYSIKTCNLEGNLLFIGKP